MAWNSKKEDFPVGCEVSYRERNYGYYASSTMIGKVVGHTDKQVKVVFDRVLPSRRDELGASPLNQPRAKTCPATVLELWTRYNERNCLVSSAERAKDCAERLHKPYEEARDALRAQKKVQREKKAALAAFDAESAAMIAAGTLSAEVMNPARGW